MVITVHALHGHDTLARFTPGLGNAPQQRDFRHTTSIRNVRRHRNWLPWPRRRTLRLGDDWRQVGGKIVIPPPWRTPWLFEGGQDGSGPIGWIVRCSERTNALQRRRISIRSHW